MGSNLIPQETIDILRHYVDVSVRNFGIDCELYIPQNLDTVDVHDVYTTPSDLQYVKYETQVFINWSPTQRHLRQLGIYTEDDLPILAYFANYFQNEDGSETFVDIPIGSYIKLNLQYVPAQYDTDEFEVVDILIPAMYNAEVIKLYRLAPRRV